MEDRFLRHVSKSDEVDGCWLWTGGKTPNGYGMFTIETRTKRTENAHRVAYKLWKGEIPEGVWVLHKCRNKCVNPDHLDLGTPRKNNKEDKQRDGTLLQGVRNPSVKYSEEQIIEIRRRYSQGETQTSISKSTGIKQGHISDICLRKVWSHI
jgi:hypothetical protein